MNQICYLPLELEFGLFNNSPFIGHIYNVELPLSYELYSHIILTLKYEGDMQFLTKDTCILKIYNAYSSYDTPYMCVKDITENLSTHTSYTIQNWLLKKVTDIKNLRPRMNLITTVEYHHELMKMEVPNKIKEYFPWATYIKKEMKNDTFHIYYGDMYIAGLCSYQSFED